jgi:hypothetical protein
MPLCWASLGNTEHGHGGRCRLAPLGRSHLSRIPAKHFDSFVLLISWHLWKHRNNVVFEHESPSHPGSGALASRMRDCGAVDGLSKSAWSLIPGARSCLQCKSLQLFSPPLCKLWKSNTGFGLLKAQWKFRWGCSKKYIVKLHPVRILLRKVYFMIYLLKMCLHNEKMRRRNTGALMQSGLIYLKTGTTEGRAKAWSVRLVHTWFGL